MSLLSESPNAFRPLEMCTVCTQKNSPVSFANLWPLLWEFTGVLFFFVFFNLRAPGLHRFSISKLFGKFPFMLNASHLILCATCLLSVFDPPGSPQSWAWELLPHLPQCATVTALAWWGKPARRKHRARPKIQGVPRQCLFPNHRARSQLAVKLVAPHTFKESNAF